MPTGGQQTAGNNQDGSGQDGSGQDGSGQEGSGENEAGGDNPFGDGQAMGSAGSSGAGDAFGDSLEEFDEEMGQAQEELARAGGGSAADEQAGGRDGEGRGPGSAEDGGVAAATGPDPRLIPGRGDAAVEGCDDEDYVARQLCEYATKETDAFARAELWREYEEYVRILREQ